MKRILLTGLALSESLNVVLFHVCNMQDAYNPTRINGDLYGLPVCEFLQVAYHAVHPLKGNNEPGIILM
jgi:hypothetical protein